MSEYATKGALMVCDKGVTPSKLQVTSNSLFYVQGNQVATVSDKIPNTNIMPFGVCAVTRKPCNPAPIMWTGFLTSVEIPGGNPLLKTSKIPCALGGCIKFQDSGQLKAAKVVLNPSSPQIDTLKRAAQESTPFCEECEKLKNEKKKIRAVDVYWMDDENDERHYEIFPDRPVTLYIETVDYESGENLTLNIKDSEGRLFKGEKDSMIISGAVDDNGVLIIKNFQLEYEESKKK